MSNMSINTLSDLIPTSVAVENFATEFCAREITKKCYTMLVPFCHSAYYRQIIRTIWIGVMYY
jgi:hypothetical protein